MTGNPGIRQGVKMTKHFQRGDAGAAKPLAMVVLMTGWLRHGGTREGGNGTGHLLGTSYYLMA